MLTLTYSKPYLTLSKCYCNSTFFVGDYVNEDDNNNNHQTADAVASLSAKMASLYYKPVPVCHTCYKIYTIVDDARQRALKKIALHKEKLTRQRPGIPLTHHQ